jgi:tetratricopeptide (TPR) repeat protein
MALLQRLRGVRGFVCCLLALAMLSGLAPRVVPKDTWIEVRSPNFVVISNAGDKEARKIADQFEQFREVFHNSFPKLRVDLGKPLIIFAVKNEDSLKALIPAYWESKGHVHPDGLYVPGEERHYVALRTDLETENPYQVIYHEYTHAIMNLNFRGLPVWLNEGLAEFYGNSVIYDKYVEIGKAAPYHLQTLQTERLIPIDALFQADESSPYYNEANHATMFYAESWAIVHYLMLDPQAREKKLLNNFMSDWDKSGDQIQAAEQTFGDLRKFGDTMQGYARQRAFYVAKITTTIHGDPKSFASRTLPDAELNAQRALFYAHTQRAKEAEAAVEDALKEDPNLALAYEAKGFLAYAQQQFAAAEPAFQKAIELGSTDYFPYYFAAEAQLRNGLPSMSEAPKVIASLEKAIQMNPQFAPAYAALASVYSINPDTREKAFAAGKKAVELEPGNLGYATSYGYVLANAGKTEEAKKLAKQILQVARTPMDRANAQQLMAVVVSHEEYDNRMAEVKKYQSEHANTETVNAPTRSEDRPSTPAPPASSTSGTATGTNAGPPATASSAHKGEQEYAVEGNILSADCVSGPGKVSLAVGTATMNFWFPDFAGLEVVSTAKQDRGDTPACEDWKGRHVRLYFYKVRKKDFTGDLNTVQFY